MRILLAHPQLTDEAMSEVAACVREGGTVIFPTETVYGLGCEPECDDAIEAIYRAKGRSEKKPLALHIADRDQATPFLSTVTVCGEIAMRELWPGPVAIIVARRKGRFEHAARGFDTISLRCPDHALCRALLRATGPLAATSANRSGARAFTGEANDLSCLPDATLAVLAGATPLQKESTVLDCSSQTPRILREGAVPAAAIAKALGTSCELR